MCRAGQHEADLVLFAVEAVVEHVAVHFHFLLFFYGSEQQVGEGVEPVGDGEALQEEQLVEVPVPNVAFLVGQHEVPLSVFHAAGQEDVVAVGEGGVTGALVNADAASVALERGFPPDAVQLSDLCCHVEEQQGDTCGVDGRQVRQRVVPCGGEGFLCLFGRAETVSGRWGRRGLRRWCDGEGLRGLHGAFRSRADVRGGRGRCAGRGFCPYCQAEEQRGGHEAHPEGQERLCHPALASHVDKEPVEDVEGRAGQQRGERVEARDELQVVEVCLVHGIGG